MPEMHLKRPRNSIYDPHYVLLHYPTIVEKIVLIAPLPYASTMNACSHPRLGTNFNTTRLCQGWKDAERVGYLLLGLAILHHRLLSGSKGSSTSA